MSCLVPPLSSNAILVSSRIHPVCSRKMKPVRLVPSDSRHGPSKASFLHTTLSPIPTLRSLDSHAPLLSWRRIAHTSSLSPQRFSLIRHGPGLMLRQETSPEHDCTPVARPCLRRNGQKLTPAYSFSATVRITVWKTPSRISRSSGRETSLPLLPPPPQPRIRHTRRTSITSLTLDGTLP